MNRVPTLLPMMHGSQRPRIQKLPWHARLAALFRPQADDFLAHVRLENFRHDHAAVGLLVVFQNGDDRPATCEGRPVERVDEAGALLAFDLVADVKPAGLVIGAVARAGHFAELATLAAAWHPGFQVVLAIGGDRKSTRLNSS